jgi:Holliday junction DNA helicase RuvA
VRSKTGLLFRLFWELARVITRISGQLVALDEESLRLQVGPIEYEVLISEFTRRQLQQQIGQQISLYTIEYLEGNPAHGRLIPRLIGFLSEAEREFFELFCSVDGVGVKKALRAMVRPVQEVAVAIEEQQTKVLAGLPGIGLATAERIVAKLRRKVPKFALMVSRGELPQESAPADVVSQTYELLLRLGHSESDARRLLDRALQSGKKYQDVQELIQAIYQQTRPR